MGTPDPRLHVEPAHDVLAAEEFALGDSDPALHHHGPVTLPGDPTGIAEPHDVLAAEEFAMPAAAADRRSAGGSAAVAAAARRGRTRVARLRRPAPVLAARSRGGRRWRWRRGSLGV